jgi:hypothetical protein
MVHSNNATAVKTGSSLPYDHLHQKSGMITFIKNLFRWAPHALPQLIEASLLVLI